MVTVNVGDTIKIISMDGEPQYKNTIGQVTIIDDIGQIHGTWGGCAVVQNLDEFIVIKKGD